MNFYFVFLLTFCLVFKSLAETQTRPTARSKDEKLQTEKLNSSNGENKNFVIGAELRSYNYSEPGVSHSGLLYGVTGEWNWRSQVINGKVYGNLFYGVLTYDGKACDQNTGICTPLVASTTDIISKVNARIDYSFIPELSVFIGGGYRYLYDKGDGPSFYTRQGQWFYIPLGAAYNVESKMGKLFFELEYDLTLTGNMKSNLSEAISTYSDISSNQTGGYGLVLSAGMQFWEDLNGYVLYESWNANKSDISIVGNNEFWEPENSSQALGLNLSYSF